MPTEVYPSISHHEAYPVPRAAYTPLPMMMGGWSSMPGSGPARSIECIPREFPYHNGGRILPGGLRNPWAPYSGDTYMPAAEVTENKLYGARSAYGVANLAGAGGSVILPAGSLAAGVGAGASVVSGLSHITGRSVPSIGLGGMRNDDDRDGSVGRVHAGFSPDMTSTAGAIPRIAQSSHWLQAPSGPMNHVRMTPSLAPPVAHTILASRSVDSGYLNRPMDPSRPRRIPSIKHKPSISAADCPECAQCPECDGVAGGKSLRLERSRSRRKEDYKEAGSPGSAYRKLSRTPLISSSLRPKDDMAKSKGDRRSSSGRSSPPKSERCVECAA